MKLYRSYLSMLLKSQMQYKTSFFLSSLGLFLTSFTGFLSMYFLFDRFHSVNGFSFAEVLLCYAVVFMAFSTAECFARGFDVFPRLIRSGNLDRILVRPRGVIFQVLTSNIEFTRFARFLQGLLVLIYAMPASGVIWTWDKILTLSIMLIGGIVVFSSLFVLYAGISFFTIEGLEFMNIFTDGGRQFGSYPLAIYGEPVLKFFTYVIPLALFQYYPFLYLVGRSADRRLMLLPLLGFVFLLPCYGFFRFGLRKYQSTGS